MTIKNSLCLRATPIDSKSYTPAEFLQPILHNLPKRSKETEKAKTPSKASEKGSSNRSILLSQRHQTSFKASPVATYQHSRTTNPQMETSCYKRKYPKSSVILHHNNPWRKNPETELPTDKGSSSTHEAWQSSTLTRPTSSHKRFKSTSQSLYDKEWTSCAAASLLQVRRLSSRDLRPFIGHSYLS